MLAKAMGKDRKMMGSIYGYVAAIAASFFYPPISLALYAGVALAWLVPDKRIERVMKIG